MQVKKGSKCIAQPIIEPQLDTRAITNDPTRIGSHCTEIILYTWPDG